MSWFQFEDGRNAAWFQLIKDFHASQNDYRIKWTGWPGENYTSHVLVQQQSGGISADVMTLIPDLAYRVARAGALAPIEDIVVQPLDYASDRGARLPAVQWPPLRH